MRDLDRRIARLEASAPGGRVPEVPLDILLYLKTLERHQARENDAEPPPYSADELAAMYRDDLEDAAGAGTVGMLRASGGWQTPEAAELLDLWEEDARRRLELIQDLPPERWGEVYEDDHEGDE